MRDAASAAHTLLLMADNRNPLCSDYRVAPFYSLAAVLNLEYAVRHGYDFLYYLISPELPAAESGAWAFDVGSASGSDLAAVASYLLEAASARINYSRISQPLLRRWNYLSRGINRRLLNLAGAGELR